MPKKMYILARYAWEYNDEYNYTPEGDPTDPKTIYHKKSAADKAAEKCNIDGLKGLNLSEYGCEGLTSNLTNMTEGEFVEFMKKLGAKDFSGDEPVIPAKLPRGAYLKILKEIDIRFYTVIEAPVK